MELIHSGAGDSSGWSTDISFGKNTSSSHNSDRFPVPVTISHLLSNIDENESAYSVGTYSFTKVQVIGMIENEIEENGNTKYILVDPENKNKRIAVLQFNSAAVNENFVNSKLMVDDRVRVYGKLNPFEGEIAILVFSIQECRNDIDYRIYQLEARAAQLFFEKNVIERIRCGQLRDGYGMLAPPWSRTVAQSKPINIISPKKEYKKIEAVDIIGRTTTFKDYTGTKAKVYGIMKSIIRSGLYSDRTGIPFETIHAKMSTTTNRDLRNLLEQIINDGNIYVTEKEHYWTTND